MQRESQTTAPRRRSPIKKPPLRTAGQSLREQMFDLLFDRWLSYGLALAVVWLLVLLDCPGWRCGCRGRGSRASA